jgi:hypothetical protein
MEYSGQSQGCAWLMVVLGGILALATGCQPAPRDLSSSTTPTPLPSPTASPTGQVRTSSAFGTLAVRVGHESIWLVRGGDKPRLLTQGHEPQLAPDGCHLIFRRPGDNDSCNQNSYRCFDLDVWFINIAGTEIKRLFSPYDEWEALASLESSPDAKGLAATTMGTAKALPGEDLYWVSVPRGTITQLAESKFQGGNSAGGTPHFSPDGNWIATTVGWTGYNQGSVGLVRLDTHASRQVFYPQWGWGQELAWANDSSGFVAALLVERGAEKENAILRVELWWVPVVGEPKRLADLGDGATIRSPQWQPGGGRLAYGLDPQPGKVPASVHLAARDGSQDAEVPGSAGLGIWSGRSSPWSPDGTWLLLQGAPPADRPGSTPKVYLVNTQRLADPQFLDVGSIQGWLDATHYLVSTFDIKRNILEFSVCDTDRACRLWAQIPNANPNQYMDLSYVNKICTK